MVPMAERQYPWVPVKLLYRSPFENRPLLTGIDEETVVFAAGRDTLVPGSHPLALARAADIKRQRHEQARRRPDEHWRQFVLGGVDRGHQGSHGIARQEDLGQKGPEICRGHRRRP